MIILDFYKTITLYINNFNDIIQMFNFKWEYNNFVNTFQIVNRLSLLFKNTYKFTIFV